MHLEAIGGHHFPGCHGGQFSELTDDGRETSLDFQHLSFRFSCHLNAMHVRAIVPPVFILRAEHSLAVFGMPF